jgi:hypothetical protein
VKSAATTVRSGARTGGTPEKTGGMRGAESISPRPQAQLPRSNFERKLSFACPRATARAAMRALALSNTLNRRCNNPLSSPVQLRAAAWTRLRS